MQGLGQHHPQLARITADVAQIVRSALQQIHREVGVLNTKLWAHENFCQDSLLLVALDHTLVMVEDVVEFSALRMRVLARHVEGFTHEAADIASAGRMSGSPPVPSVGEIGAWRTVVEPETTDIQPYWGEIGAWRTVVEPSNDPNAETEAALRDLLKKLPGP